MFIRTRSHWIHAIVGMTLAAAISCGGGDPTGPGTPPSDHTIIRDGAAHAPGLNDPTANCATCHGADLRGGIDNEPSCFSCHSKVWP